MADHIEDLVAKLRKEHLEHFTYLNNRLSGVFESLEKISNKFENLRNCNHMEKGNSKKQKEIVSFNLQ